MSVLMPREVLTVLQKQAEPTTAAELARHFGVHVLTVAAVLSCLEDQGKARPVAASGDASRDRDAQVGGRMTARVRWDINAEMGCTDNGEFMPGWVRVECPVCGREGSPLMSRLTRVLRSYWSWVGISYSAPHTDYEARCPGCRVTYQFTTYWPQ